MWGESRVPAEPARVEQSAGKLARTGHLGLVSPANYSEAGCKERVLGEGPRTQTYPAAPLKSPELSLSVGDPLPAKGWKVNLVRHLI